MRKTLSFFFAVFLFFLNISKSDHSNDLFLLHDDLKVFKYFIGKTFSGEIQNYKKDSYVNEIVNWEAIFKGNGIRIKHSINNDEFIGESIIMFDGKEKSYSCWYFSSGGISNKSKFLIEDNKIIFFEDVSENNNSITKIRTSYLISENGGYYKKILYLINNVWVKGNNILYKNI